MSTALYRRYRPETFAEVIGQEHVTEPLITALQNNRVNHAYLFSGPRGCGKTTSARILARCLNCVQGPTPTPCGVCDSCRELSRDGSGSLDVIEMDAASHGGVDHARDLRERATFAPVRDRYKIFIIDEAHMVTREGFNALLKIVEEPPEHIKFIFATTEPNKVLGTIRSRTHHYPFRLVPPETLHDYLAQLCEEENVSVASGVLQLVVRAGGGSVRDSLSILDQLMAGSGSEGITYDLAVALLGYTHAELLDEVVLAFAHGNAAEVFRAVDRVIQSGQDPRRFVEDLLERFRDLIIVQAVPDSAEAILHGMGAEQIARLRAQAAEFGAAELSRAADVTNDGLNEMSGATSPQLHLELLCARILLPASDKTVGGVGARLDRLERRVANGDIPVPSGASAQPGQAVAGAEQSAVAPQLTQQAQPTQPIQQAPLANLRRTSRSDQAETRSPQHAPQNAPEPNSARAQRPVQKSAHSIQRPSASAPSPTPITQRTQQPSPQEVVSRVRGSWQNILNAIQSPQAREGFARCEPTRFKDGAIYLRATMSTLKQVKDFLPQLKAALREVVQLDLEIHAEVAKPQPGGNVPTSQRPAQSTRPVQSSPAQPFTPQPPVANGPRGGEEAWRTHGQPRTTDTPQWSTEDWNNPVTEWAVAPIPSGNDTKNSALPGNTVKPAENNVQLRVIDGEGADNPQRSRDSHPSSGKWKRPDISAAPDAEETMGSKEDEHSHVSQPVDSTGQAAQDPVQEGMEDAEESAGSSPVAAVPDMHSEEDTSRYTDEPDTRTPNTGIADGTAEAAPAEESMIPELEHTPEPPQPQDIPEPKAERNVPSSERPVTTEYGDYEGGHYDDAPPEDDEYVSGVGYVNNSSQGAAESAPAPAGVLPPLAQTTQQNRQASPLRPSPAEEDTSAPTSEQHHPSRLKSNEGAETPKPGFRERFAEQLAAGQRASARLAQAGSATNTDEPENFSVSDDDEALESSVLIGQRAVEKILGGVVIDERPYGQ